MPPARQGLSVVAGQGLMRPQEKSTRGAGCAGMYCSKIAEKVFFKQVGLARRILI
jgi:hypothetical protein